MNDQLRGLNLREWVEPGTQITRKDIDHSQTSQQTYRRPDGWYVTVYRLYRCDGPYCLEQPITVLGWRVSVYTSEQGPQWSRALVDDLEEITDDLIDRLVEEAAAQCAHTNSRHVANLGRCYNRYECRDCGAQFNIDSSD